MKKLKVIALACLILSCNRGTWLSPHIYRPKHPKFSLLKKPFQANAFVNTNTIYTTTNKFRNFDGNLLIGYMGFYQDGRLIVDASWEKQMLSTLADRNTFAAACSIGYYTTSDSTIQLEYFLPGDGGHYYKRQGIIKKDTIILIEKRRDLQLKMVYRYDTLVASTFKLK